MSEHLLASEQENDRQKPSVFGIAWGFARLAVYSCTSWVRFTTFWRAVGVLVAGILALLLARLASLLTANGKGSGKMTWLVKFLASMRANAFAYAIYATVILVSGLLVGAGVRAYLNKIEYAAEIAEKLRQAQALQQAKDEAYAKAKAERDKAAEAERLLREKTATASPEQIDDMLRQSGAMLAVPNTRSEASSNTPKTVRSNTRSEASSNTPKTVRSNTRSEASSNTPKTVRSNTRSEASSNTRKPLIEQGENAPKAVRSNTRSEASSNTRSEASSNTRSEASSNTRSEASSNTRSEASSNTQFFADSFGDFVEHLARSNARAPNE